jgi:hypothetical protein
MNDTWDQLEIVVCPALALDLLKPVVRAMLRFIYHINKY